MKSAKTEMNSTRKIQIYEMFYFSINFFQFNIENGWFML